MTGQYFNMKNRKHLNGPSAAVIKYDEEKGGAPVVVAQGTALVAQKIIEAAKQNNIHLQEDSTLIQNLLQIDLGETVPPQLYEVIAEVFILLEKLDENY
ncbi:EscU/YscU/HrcU family type III secretion system export apparatus switch protein [Neobacillus sp. PS3-34]|uniref:EscU/YscU/HrcU family type III secretion system export apparatus switch protein n=1 Tax=Neobacillus sp. PS3-34 TaxID=3070678 RepID=UPI0027E1033D|nr:EscU/YscU/HrcU family type III secretion system export apparatus switch protein [Neobacillus sp. PS3-34]WML46898.1 EscU/YscU/HrcU family type III secretion system export apparatus switch protein [Neobacillus sp. PS3-34]